MLPQSRDRAAWVRPGIIQLSAVRNKYGHQLDHTVEFPAISAVMEVLSVSRSGQEFSTPIDAIEAFAPVACAFLTVPPQHISDAFAQAFKDVHSTDGINKIFARRSVILSACGLRAVDLVAKRGVSAGGATGQLM